MNTNWALQDAKSKFSKVVDMALREGPQVVTRHGTSVVVIMSMGEYEKRQRPKEEEKEESFGDFVARTIPFRIDLDITRDPDPGREVVFENFED
jgi:prevent-host-death family protein